MLKYVLNPAVRFTAAFSLLHALALVFRPLGTHGAWFSVLGLPSTMGLLWAVLLTPAVMAYRWLPRWGRIAALAVVAATAALCVYDSISFYRLLAAGAIRSSMPLPMSLVLAVLLIAWAMLTLRRHGLRRPSPAGADGAAVTRHPAIRRVGLAAGLAACYCIVGLGLILCEILTFGATDYRRPADAIVVFGAGVYSDGTPSQALYDRTRTGCLLYQQGLAKSLVFSGGRDSGSVCSEPQAMRQIAMDMGIADDAIVLDEAGVSTQATVDNVATLAPQRGWRSVLAVSHDYHLSRIKLLSVRAGLRAYTVPAEETRRLVAKPYFIQRELAAWAYHYFRQLTGQDISQAAS
jgi:uncharacterized SAM-binding protein YcdF (DUF218 family)